MNHIEARDLFEKALTSIGEKPTPQLVHYVQAMAHNETTYARWDVANNFGAVQKGSTWTGKTKVKKDSYVNKDGKTVFYEIAFRVYSTPLEGAADMARIILQSPSCIRARGAIERGDILQASRDLRVWRSVAKGGQDASDRLGYYEGHGATPDIRERNHAAAIYRSIIAANLACGCTKLPDGVLDTPPTISAQSCPPGWREALAIWLPGDDGTSAFPSDLVKAYQKRYNLVQDSGTVGPQVWGHLFAFFGTNGKTNR